jgi:hypothetical protein
MAEYCRAGGFIGRYSWTLCFELWLPQQGVWALSLIREVTNCSLEPHACYPGVFRGFLQSS